MSDFDQNKAGEAFQDAANEATRNAQDMMGQAERTTREMLGNAQALAGMDPAKMTETLRAMTQKSMEQSREAYSRMKSAADDATRTLESTMENVHQGSLQLSKRAIDAMRSNADLGFSHLEKLMAAKSLSEVIELQTSYVRRQVETATDQAKEMQALTQSIAQDMLKPGREAFQRASDAAKGV